jgi:hypothetical protein
MADFSACRPFPLVVIYFVCPIFGDADHFVDHRISHMAQMEVGCLDPLKVPTMGGQLRRVHGIEAR